MTELENTAEKKDSLFRFSISFFVLVLVFSAILFGYKYSIDSEISDKRTNLIDLEKSISDLSSDKKIQVYSLYMANKSTIDDKQKKSNINTYIDYMKTISKTYGVLFNGFNYDGAKIVTNLIATTDTNIAYLKLVKFIGDYRTTTNDLLNLGFVQSFTGNDKITTNVVFDLK